MQSEQQIKYCLYARKSSESDERQAMSIDSQIKELRDLAQKEGLNIVETQYESKSAKQSGQRETYNQVLADIENDKYNALLVWAPDRLSRNAGDLGMLVDLMDRQKLAEIKTYSQKFTNNPNEKFLLMILCSQAKLENDNRAVNVKRGIRAKCEMGWRPCMPPLGYFTRASTGNVRDVIVDKERAPYIAQMFEMSAAGKSGRHIKQWLIDNDIKTRKDKVIHLSMIYNMLKNTFYYGEFEYPTKSGNWYQGKHEPLIEKALFDEVQKQLVVPQKSKWGAKEFPFKQFLKCGSCGSAVVGEEKFKQRKDGGYNRHVYYHCSRQVKYDCTEPYVKEKDIIDCLINIHDQLINDIDNIEPGLRESMEKFGSMSKMYRPHITRKEYTNNYIDHVLNEGSLYEKTKLIRNIDVELTLYDRQLLIAE